VQAERLQVSGNQYSQHARHRLCLGRVDLLDARVAIGRGVVAVDHARQFQVVDMVPLP
jgi:hypothetical protein